MPGNRRKGSSGRVDNLPDVIAQEKDEHQYGEIDIVLLCIEDARRRAERAADELRAGGAEDFLIEALEQSKDELSATAKRLTQGTFFAVPSAQLTL